MISQIRMESKTVDFHYILSSKSVMLDTAHYVVSLLGGVILSSVRQGDASVSQR